MYIVLPFVLPAVGIARGVGPVVGIAIGLLAVVSIIYSIRRFWRADHSKRWHYTIFGTAIIAFLVWATIARTRFVCSSDLPTRPNVVTSTPHQALIEPVH